MGTPLNIDKILGEKKDMSWKDDVDSLEKLVEEGQELQQELNDCISAANAKQQEYNIKVAAIEAMRTKVLESVGNIFGNQNVRARVF